MKFQDLARLLILYDLIARDEVGIAEPDFTPYKTQFVPYYAWSNRGTAEMTVFMPMIWE